MAERSVTFSVKARDEYSKQFKAAQTAAEKLRSAQEKATAHRQQTSALTAEIAKLQTGYQRAAADAARLGAALTANSRAESYSAEQARQLRDAFGEARARASEFKAELLGQQAALRSLKGAQQGSFAALEKNIGAMERQAQVAREAAAALREGQVAQRQVASQAAPVAGNTIQRNLSQMSTLRQESSRLQREYENLRTETTRLGKALATTDAPTEAMIADFQKAKAAMATMRVEMERVQTQATKFTATGATNGGFSAFIQRTDAGAVRAASQMAKAEAEATKQVRTRLGLWGRLVDNYNSAIQTQQGRGFLGLRPYEVTNLSYQINDLITQVASGTSPMQAFAQQGGQIAQIFPAATASILRMTPALAPLAAGILTVVQAFSRLRETDQILTDFAQQLIATADPEQYDPAQLTELVRQLERIGVAAEESQASISALMRDGFSTVEMERFIITARDMAAVTGETVPEAVKRLTDAFDGTFESIDEFDKAQRFLTAAQRELIRGMFEQGRAIEATQVAFDAFTERQAAAAELERGDWYYAKLDLANAWRNLLDLFAQTGVFNVVRGEIMQFVADIQTLIGEITWLLGIFGRVQKALRDSSYDQGVADRMEAITSGLSEEQVRDRRTLNEDAAAAASRRDFQTLSGGTGPTQEELKAEQRAAEEALAEAEKLRHEQAISIARGYDTIISDANRAIEDHIEGVRRIEERQAEALTGLNQDLADQNFELAIGNEDELVQRQKRAVRDARAELAEVGLELSEQQQREIEEVTRKLYEQEQAQKAVTSAKSGGASSSKAENEEQVRLEERLTQLLERRRLLMEQIEYQDEAGNTAQADMLREQMGQANQELSVAIQNLEAFWRAAGGPEAANALLALESLKQELRTIGSTAIVSGRELNEMVAGAAASGFGDMINSIVAGENALESFGDTARKIAADFLANIAEMIAQQAILNALQGGGGADGGFGGFVSGLVNGIFRHQGGMVDNSGRSRSLPAAIFANAPRYHGGGIAGLKPNEVPAVLERGEEVLTRQDPRHAANGGGQPTPSVNIRQVNVIDPTEMLSKALQTAEGERVLFNFMGANSRRMQTLINSK